MNLKNRSVISICLIVCFIFSSVWINITAKATEIQGNKESIEYLSALGIIEKWQDDDEWFNENLQRGEMAKLACGMLGSMEIAESMVCEKIFDDVEKNSLYIDYVNYLTGMGLISGSSGNFYPKDGITYNEMAKIIVGVLGYKAEAEAKGGYPFGYLSILNRIKLFNGVEDFNGYVTRRDAYKIIMEAMEVDVMSQSGVDELYSDYKVIKGRNLLNVHHGIEIISGIVTANQYTSIYSKNGYGEGRISIGNSVYQTIVDNADMFLGYSVKAYIDDLERVIFIKENKDNNCVSVIADNISPQTTKTEFVYYVNEDLEKTKKIKIDSNASVIFNERYCAKMYTNVVTVDDLKPLSGNVFLLDNNGDMIFDLVFISSYQIYVTDSVSVNSKVIRAKYSGTEINCDVNDLLITDITGNELDISEISEWNVLAVAETKDRELLHIIVRDDSVTGEITQIGEDKVVIGDTEYKISGFFDKNESELILKERGVFYFDIENKIIAADYLKSGEIYGYLIAANMKGKIEPKLCLKLFTESGEVKVYECDEKILFNKNSDNLKLNSDQMYKKITLNDAVQNQLIKYEINAEKEIISVELACNTPNYHMFSLGYESLNAYYVVGKINYKYYMPDDVKIFSVPDDKTAEEDYVIVTKKGITGDKEYNVQLYDIDKDNYVKAAIINVGNSESVSTAEYSLAVTKVNQAIDKDGNRVSVVCGYIKGVYTELEVVDDSIETVSSGVWGYDGVRIKDLKCGDIIQVNKNAYGKVNKFRIIFRPDESVNYMLKNGELNTDISQEQITHRTLAVNYAQVVRRSSKAIIYDRDNEKILSTINLAVSPVVYIYDENARTKLIVGTMDDIEPEDYLLVLYNWSTPREYIVYRY